MIVSVDIHKPCLLFDAEGNEVMYCIWADTETGEVIQYVRKDGKFVIENNEVVKVTNVLPAPLRVEPIKLRGRK